MRAAWMAALGFLAVAGCGADRAGTGGGTGQGTARVRNQPPAYCSDTSKQTECPAIDIVQCANGQEPVIDFDSGCCPHYSCQNECPAGAVAVGCNGWPAPLCPPGTNLWIGSDEQCCALYRCMPNGSGGGGGGTGGWSGGGGGPPPMCDPRAAVACPASLPYCGGAMPVKVGEDEKCCPIWQCPCDVPPPPPWPGPGPDPQPDKCFGAWVDQSGSCRGPNDGMYPPECCIPTTDPSGPPSDGGVAPDPTFPDGGVAGGMSGGSAPGYPGGPVPPGGGTGGGMGGFCGCTYPTCGPNEVLSCFGANVCGYPCTCEPIAPPPSGECTSDDQCGPNGKCDVTACLPGPGCNDPMGGACPAVCYGKCAYDGQSGCQADAECGPGMQCRLHCWDDMNSMTGGCAGECLPQDPMGCRVTTTGGAPNTPSCPPPAACPPGTASVTVGFDPATCCEKLDCQPTCDASMGRTCAAPTCSNPVVAGVGPDCCPIFCCGSDCASTGGGSAGGGVAPPHPTPGG